MLVSYRMRLTAAELTLVVVVVVVCDLVCVRSFAITS